jgi:hypothetical protein
VFDKYDSKGNKLKKDFYYMKLPYQNDDKAEELKWRTISDE